MTDRMTLGVLLPAPSPVCGGGVGRGKIVFDAPPPAALRASTSPASGGGKSRKEIA